MHQEMSIEDKEAASQNQPGPVSSCCILALWVKFARKPGTGPTTAFARILTRFEIGHFFRHPSNPCKLGAKGLEQVIEITLTAEERIALQKSAAVVQELIDVVGI
jgi:hypothetical protein